MSTNWNLVDGCYQYFFQDWSLLAERSMTAAGYLPHCPCGCVSAKLTWPIDSFDLGSAFSMNCDKHDGWSRTPDEPLEALVYLQRTKYGLAKISWRHCVAISDRLKQLLPEFERIYGKRYAEKVASIAAHLRDNGLQKINSDFC